MMFKEIIWRFTGLGPLCCRWIAAIDHRSIAAGSRPLIIAYFSFLLATSVFNLYSRRSSEWLCK
jgi:hypothetical protein